MAGACEYRPAVKQCPYPQIFPGLHSISIQLEDSVFKIALKAGGVFILACYFVVTEKPGLGLAIPYYSLLNYNYCTNGKALEN